MIYLLQITIPNIFFAFLLLRLEVFNFQGSLDFPKNLRIPAIDESEKQ